MSGEEIEQKPTSLAEGIVCHPQIRLVVDIRVEFACYSRRHRFTNRLFEDMIKPKRLDEKDSRK